MKSTGNSVARTNIPAQSNQDITPLSRYPSSVLVVAATVGTSAQRACAVRCGVRQMAAQSPPVPRPGHTSCGTVSPGDQRCPGHSYSPTAATDRSLAELSAVDSGQCWQHGGPGPQPGAPPAQAHVLSS